MKNEKKLYIRDIIIYLKKGELDELVLNTGLAKIIKSDYNKDNWYVVAIKK